MSIISRTSKTSIHRARIASLRYIAESEDPELVQDFARVVLSEESDASDIENAGEGLEAFGNSNVSRKREVLSRRLDSASIEDDSDEDDGDHSEYMSTKADKTFTTSSKSHESENIDTAPAGRMSIDTESSQLSHGKLPNDLQARLALFGSSPGSPPTSLDLMHQRFDRSKSRKGRDSVLSGATAHSNAGSAYAVDAFGRPQRSHSRTSHTTSTGAGTPRSSMDSVRIQFRRAHKLATVFGTTRGEVFNRVLDDIEADIAEADDEEMDEEEKKEIIESVTALRASL